MGPGLYALTCCALSVWALSSGLYDVSYYTPDSSGRFIGTFVLEKFLFLQSPVYVMQEKQRELYTQELMDLEKRQQQMSLDNRFHDATSSFTHPVTPKLVGEYLGVFCHLISLSFN